MSDDHTEKPSVDTPLPDELARCESILAGMPLPPSRLSRDELLYRAGWAAAELSTESSMRDVERKEPAHGTSRRSTFAWSISSATVAASLAVGIMLQLQATVDPPDSIVDGSGENRSAIVSIDAARPTAIPISRPPQVAWTASLLIMRDRALSQQWDDPWIVDETFYVGSSSDDASLSRPKTSGEMLREFLPRPSLPDPWDGPSTLRWPDWPWKTNRVGETT